MSNPEIELAKLEAAYRLRIGLMCLGMFALVVLAVLGLAWAQG